MATALLRSNVLGVWHRSMDAEDEPQHSKQRYRRSAVFAPGVIRAGEQIFECDVLNVSAGGAMIRTHQPFRHAGSFAICIAGLKELRAQLVRSNENNHGIAFEQDPAYVADVVRELVTNPVYSRDRRAHPRRLVYLAGSFYLRDVHVPCKVQNISAGGVFVKSALRPRDGERIDLRVARFGEMPVRVVWSDTRGMGCQLLDPPDTVMARIGHLLPAADE